MPDLKDFQDFEDDFIGMTVTLPASANIGSPWLVDDTSSSGTPTYVRSGSKAILTLASTSEVENVCLHFGDVLPFDIDSIQRVEMLVNLTAVFTSGSTLVFGVGSARADDPDAVAANAYFKMVGATSTTAVYCESDDGVTDIDDKATGQTLGTTAKRFVIDFTGGKSNVRFLMDDANGNLIPVCGTTTFDMSGYSSGLQPIVQLSKAANTNVDAVEIDYIKVVCKR